MEENKKILNFVYDSWLDDKPINNGEKQFNNDYDNNWGNKIHFADFYHLVFSYNEYEIFYKYLVNQIPEENKINLKKCKIQEIYENPNENYYYFISAHGIDTEKFFNDTPIDRFFKENIKEHLLKCKNFHFCLVSEHESDSEKGLIVLNDLIKKYDIDGKQIFYINNNAKLNELKEKNNVDINVYTLNFLSISSTRVLDNAGSCNFLPEKNGKFFMCFNRGPKRHRYSLLLLLLKHNILKEINWSLIPNYFPYPGADFYEGILSKTDIYESQKEIEYFYNIGIKKNDYEIDVDYMDDKGEFKEDKLPGWMLVPTFCVNHENSYVNIVTESQYNDYLNVIHITEKSFKPFYYYQFPIILATHNHIKKMKELYDFDFFDDIVNHSYDDEPNQKKRIYMVLEEIKRLNNNQDFLKKFYKNNYERFENNKNKVIDLLHNNKDYDFFKNLI